MPKRWVHNMEPLTAVCMLEHESRGWGEVAALGATGPSLCSPQGLNLCRAAWLSLERTESIPSRGHCQAAWPHAEGSKPQPQALAGSALEDETDSCR